MPSAPERTLAQIAAELYVLAPDEFVAAREVAAKETGDPALRTQVRSLRKPSIAAWVVNLFAREHADELDEALSLAEALREAQEDLDAPAMAALSRDRRALTRRLAERAAAAAAERGEPVSASTREAVQQTLTAAFFDADAAAAVASGRLVRALGPAGTSSSDVVEAVAGDLPARRPRERPADEVGARRRRRDAERAIREAEQELAAAERELAERERAWRTLRAEVARLSERESELDGELARVRADLERLRSDVGGADAERAAAAARTQAARASAADARSRRP